MIDRRLQWFCEQRDYARYVEFLGYIEHPDGERSIVKPMQLILERQKRDEYITEGSLRLDMEPAQSLMTAMWNAGLRPHGIKTSDGEVRRIEAHLEDMRKLVSDKTFAAKD